MSRLRLLKVLVQPTFVIEDSDGNLLEKVADPVVVSAVEWPDYPRTQFAEATATLAAQLEEQTI